MITKNKKEVIQINKNKNNYIEIYLGKLLIWKIIRSCFGNGYWINDKPWINTDVWKNK